MSNLNSVLKLNTTESALNYQFIVILLYIYMYILCVNTIYNIALNNMGNYNT